MWMPLWLSYLAKANAEIVPGDKSDLKPGAKVFILATLRYFAECMSVAHASPRPVFFLLSRFRGSLIDHVRSRSSRKHVYQPGQNDEDENGRE